MSNPQRSIPIIKLYGTLIVSVQVDVTDHLVRELKDDIANAIQNQQVRGLIIEVSGVDIIDSYIARSLRDIAHISRLMGVDTVLAGLDAAMAITLVEMGMALGGIRTALNLESALELFARDAESRRSDADMTLDMVLNEATDDEHTEIG